MSRKLRFIFLFLPFACPAFSQINLQWSQTYTSTGANTDIANDIAIDASGNVYTCGTVWSGTSFDYLTIKYDNSGAQQWARTYNGAGNSIDQARAIAVDASGNVYVTGASYFAANNDDYVTIKYDASGTQQWVKNYNGPGNVTDEAYDIALDASGNVFVTGGSGGSGTGEDFATLKYDPATGNQLALIRYTFTGANLDRGQAITIDNSGNVYVTGYSYGGSATDYDYATLKYTNALVAVWGSASRYNGVGSKIDQASKIVVNNATGNVYVTGYSNNTYVLDDDITTVMYNSSGAQQWVSRYGALNNEQDRAYGLDIDGSGNAYVTGKVVNTSSIQDMVTVKYNVSGAQQWAAVYNGPSNNWDEGRTVKVDASGTYLYVNGFSFTTGQNHDITTVKYDAATGAQQWIIKYNSPSNNVDKGYSMVIDAASNIYVAGESKTSASGSDAITIKYCQLTADAGTDQSICLGNFTQLSATAPGAVGYSWWPSTGLSNTGISNPIATPTVTTDYVVAITNTSGCVDLDTVRVTVYALPAPAITANGPVSFCIGDSVGLCSGGTFNTYTWSPGGATTSCLTVMPTDTTVYTLTVTDTNTCAAQSSITVTVNPLPIADAGSDTSVCLSHNAQLNASGGVTYSWLPSGTLSNSAVANPIAGPVSTTTYTVWVTSAAGCSSVDSVTVTVVPNPAVPSLTYSNGVLCSSAATTYQWYIIPNTPISGATSQCYTPTADTTYYVIVTNSTGCTTASAQITVNDVGISEYDAVFGSSLYPNPSNGQFTLELNLGAAQNIRVNVLNITGEVVFTEELVQASGNVKKEFDLKDLRSGMYLVQLISAEGTYVRPVIIH
jgi:hypothetical protein